MIYFLQSGNEEGPVKIGYASKQAGHRLRGLQIGNPDLLRMIRVLPGTRKTERLLHARFADFWLRGEWFRFDSAMLTIEIPIGAEDEDLPFRVDRASERAALNRDVRAAAMLNLPVEAHKRLVARARAAGVPTTRMAVMLLTELLMGEESAPAIDPALLRIFMAAAMKPFTPPPAPVAEDEALIRRFAATVINSPPSSPRPLKGMSLPPVPQIATGFW